MVSEISSYSWDDRGSVRSSLVHGRVEMEVVLIVAGGVPYARAN